FVRPDGLVDVDVCDTSGLLPTKYCPRVRSEIFLEGTQPTSPDDSYRPLALDAATNLLWADGCLGPKIEKVFRFYPPDALDWAQKKGLTEPPETDCRGVPAPGAQVQQGADQSAARNTPPLVVVTPPNNAIYE